MGLSDLKVTPFGLPKIKKGSWIRIGGVRALNIYVDHHFNWFQKGAFVVVHNHPSGDPTPSKLDIDAAKNY